MAAKTVLGLPSEGEVILALRNMAAKTVLGLSSEGEVILALRNMAAKTVLGLPSEGEVILALGRPFGVFCGPFSFFLSVKYTI